VKKLAVTFMTLLVMVCLIAGCGGREEPVPFSLQVIPERMEDTIPDQRCVFLVTIEDNNGGSTIKISATAPGSTVTVNPKAITTEQVVEVMVVPDKASTGSTLTVTINGERYGLKQTEMVTVDVLEGLGEVEGELASLAAEMRDKFIPWLATNYHELGITSETEWTPSIVRPHIMVVMYHLFFSEDWEMGVQWHVTIPPHNWTRIYLRDRTTETSPFYAFEISSWSTPGEEPHAIEPPESVWR
jgi:hypothetical protein